MAEVMIFIGGALVSSVLGLPFGSSTMRIRYSDTWLLIARLPRTSAFESVAFNGKMSLKGNFLAIRPSVERVKWRLPEPLLPQSKILDFHYL